MESRLKNRGAFTLVELLVVIAIIAVVATLGIAAFGPITRGVQLSEAARLLHGEINHARQSAVAFQRETEIRFFQTERLGVTRWSGLQILLADGAGAIVPFRDAAAIAREVNALLDDEKRLNANRKQAYLSGRHMVWAEVAKSYTQVFE